MPVRTRFAPSPTGRLHLGHVLAARVAWSLARESSGTFLLRHEDIDGPRVREEFYQGIEDDLHWLGLDWNALPVRQIERSLAYEAALTPLREMGLVYPCFCTRREIQQEWARMAAAPQASRGSEAPIYPGTCRSIPASIRDELIASGIPHAWRLDSQKAGLSAGPIHFKDLRFGTIAVDHGLMGDVVLARKDIGTAYHLAVVVDDAWQEISHVTRGDDLFSSTHVHRLLQAVLGLPEPIYLHHPLMRDESGKRLAKRDASRSIESLRQSGRTASEVLDLIPLDSISGWIQSAVIHS